MQLSKMKNIIVLKGMSSNIIDEAIVLLKPNIKIKQNEYDIKKDSDSIKNKKMIVVKEAQNTIESYVKKIQSNKKEIEQENLKKKYKILQIVNVVLVLTIMISTILIK